LKDYLAIYKCLFFKIVLSSGVVLFNREKRGKLKICLANFGEAARIEGGDIIKCHRCGKTIHKPSRLQTPHGQREPPRPCDDEAERELIFSYESRDGGSTYVCLSCRVTVALVVTKAKGTSRKWT
jgi:hypothetical protein